MVVSECKTYLVHHIDKDLCIIPAEATDYVTLILARENHLNQGWEFIQGEQASDQTFTGRMFTADKRAVKLLNVGSSE